MCVFVCLCVCLCVCVCVFLSRTVPSSIPLYITSPPPPTPAERRDTSELHVELSPGNAAGVFIILGGSISAAAALWIFTFAKKYL